MELFSRKNRILTILNIKVDSINKSAQYHTIVTSRGHCGNSLSNNEIVFVNKLTLSNEQLQLNI